MSFLKRGKTWLFLHTLQTQLDLAEAQQPEHIIKVELLFHLSSFLQVNVNLFYPTIPTIQARHVGLVTPTRGKSLLELWVDTLLPN